MRIVILSDQKKTSRNFHDFFPLFKWEKQLSKDGFDIEFYYDHKEIENRYAAVYIISSRYSFFSRKEFSVFLKKIKKEGNRVALFDASDTSGIVDFDLIDDVDAIIKKQVLKELDLYTENKQDVSVRPWLQNMPANPAYLNYIPCPKEALHKIKVGWNLGLCDYRYFPSYTGLIRNYLITELPKKDINKCITSKDLFTAYRGTVNYGNKEISFQRNKVLNIINESKIPSILLGEKVSKGIYLKELSKSRVSISPFGWGEICYRDFEIMYNGGLLIKPSMDHLLTFPDLYIANETYIKIGWDIADLNEKLNEINAHYENYTGIVRNAHEKFMNHQNNYAPFGAFFKSLMKSI